MKYWRCIKTYSFQENDGNGDITVFVFAGQIFGFPEYGENVGGEWSLPGNFDNQFKEYFEQITL